MPSISAGSRDCGQEGGRVEALKLMSGRCRVAERSVILELEFIQTIEDDRGCVWGEKDEPADHQSTPHRPQTRHVVGYLTV